MEKADFHEIEDFLIKWETPLRTENDEAINIDLYIDELDALISALMQR